MKISVITVCKNSEAHIERAIKSVISQTYKDIEYIIIDGDSQDKTKDIIEKYADYITCFVSEPDSGIYNAMNKGIKIATGSYIQFLNSDDYFYDDNVVRDVVEFIKHNPDSDIVYGDAHIRSNPKISKNSFIVKSPLPEEIPDALIYGVLFLQGSIFFKSSIFLKLGYFDEKYKISSDYEYYSRFLNYPDLIIRYYSRNIFSYYAGGISGNVSVTLQEMFQIQNEIDLFRSNYWQNRRILKFQSTIVELNRSLYNALEASEKQRRFIQNLKNPLFVLKMIAKYLRLKVLREKNVSILDDLKL